MALESPAARAERMAALMSVWGEVRPIEDTIAKIDAVDVDRARAVLDDPRVAYVHVRSSTNNCFTCRIDRA